MSILQCTSCGLNSLIPRTAETNIEFYGSKNVKVKCPHCRKIILVRGTVIVKFRSIRTVKEDKEYDWEAKK